MINLSMTNSFLTSLVAIRSIVAPGRHRYALNASLIAAKLPPRSCGDTLNKILPAS